MVYLPLCCLLSLGCLAIKTRQDKTRQDDLFNSAQPAFFASVEIDKNYSLTLPR